MTELSPEAAEHLRWLRASSEAEISRKYHEHMLIRYSQLSEELSDDAFAYLVDLRR